MIIDESPIDTLEEYRLHIDRLMREMSGEIVLNGSYEHAAVIVERMFANARRCVNILSLRLDQRVYGTPETVQEAARFLRDSAHSARILVESLDTAELEKHPFIVRMRDAIARRALQIRKLPSHVSDNLAVNFSLMDGNLGYRFEENKEEAIATAAFGPTPFAQKLEPVFESLWKRGEPVTL
jgi:hypothetical protein